MKLIDVLNHTNDQLIEFGYYATAATIDVSQDTYERLVDELRAMSPVFKKEPREPLSEFVYIYTPTMTWKVQPLPPEEEK